MVDGKLFKTKLCLLYQKGRCNRQNCSFAHGNADLRRSIIGRREYGGRDLREKLDKRRSPVHRYSYARDDRGRNASHGAISPRSISRRNDRKHWNKQLDGEGHFSGSQKSPEVNEVDFNGKRQVSSDYRDIFHGQLRQVQSKIILLVDHKRKLELCLEECAREADGLTSKIQDLKMQLNKEKEDCKRTTSKIKKFMKAYCRHSRLQDELKRSYDQLQKLGEMLNSDVRKPGSNREDLSNNFTSDEEPADYTVQEARDEQQKNALSNRKRSRVNPEVDIASNQDNNSQGEETKTREIKSRKISQLEVPHARSGKSKDIEINHGGKNGFRPLDSEGKARKGKNVSKDKLSADKSKPSPSGLALVSTSMAAHPVDEVVEIVENEEKFDVIGNAGCDNEVTDKVTQFPFLPPPPPPPPIPQNVYSQYKGTNECVDVDGVDEEMAHVDID